MSKCLMCTFSFVCSLFMTFISVTSVRCVMGCSAAMATGVLRVLHVGVLCSDCPLGFLVLNAAFTVRIVGKEARRVTGQG